MSGAQKISLSLLISVVVFAALAVLVAVDRFQVAVAQFYIPRVEESVRARAERATELFDEYHRTNIALFEEFTREPSVQAAFRINASSQEIRERENRLDTVEQERSSLDIVRIINTNATELHYSSEPDDYAQSGTRRSYLRPDQASAGEPLGLAELAYTQASGVGAGASAEAVGVADIFLEAENNQFIYRLPAIDANGVVQGAALFYVNTSDLRTTLVRAGIVGLGERILVVNGSGVIANAPTRFADELVTAAGREWAAIAAVSGETGRVTLTNDDAPETEPRVDGEGDPDVGSENGASLSYEAFAVGSETDGVVVFLEPSASLQMPELLQYTLLVAVFLTTFLIVFLLLNVRQDAIVVISDRVKRFQISLLREYMEKRREIDFHRWKKELEDRRDEVHREIRRGIGRVRPSQEEEVNELINESWDEIITVLGSRAEERPTVSLDVDRIEEIVNQLSDRLSHMNIGRAAPPAAIPASPPRPVEVEEVTELETGEDVEELDEAEELAELEGGDDEELAELAGDEDEELAELEGDADEELAELARDDRDAAFTGAADAGEPSARPALGTPVEVEELDDSDEVDELDEIGEADDVDELDELDESDEPDEAAVARAPLPVEASEEASARPAPGTPVEVEELDEADLVEELEEAEEVDELDGAEEVEPVEEVEEVEEVVELESPESEVEPPRVDSEVSLDSLDEATELEWLARTESAELPRAALSDLQEASFPPPGLEAETLEDEIEDLGVDEVSLWEESDEVELEEAEPVDDTGGSGEEELEYLELDEAGGEPDVPEELPDAERAATTFGSGLFSFGRGVDVRLQPASAATEQEPTPADHTAGGLIRFTDAREGARSDYEIASLESILDRLNVDRRVVVETDGVIEIGRDVYSDGARGHDVETRDLVDSIIGTDEDEGASGIELLFGGGSDDLLPELRKQEPTIRRETGVSLFRFVEQGFDYDAFLRGYQPNDSGVLKSMVRFTRFWSARIGLLLLNADNRLLPSFQLGMDPRCADTLAITKSSGLFRNVLDRRNVLLVRQPIVNVEYFHGLCRPESLSLFERSLFLPIVFRGEPAYALLGLSREMDSLEHVFRQIVPRLSRPQGAAI